MNTFTNLIQKPRWTRHILVFCFMLFTMSGNAAVFFELGTLQSLNTTITNANSGETVSIVGDYHVLSGTITGTAANDDILLGSTHNQFMVWEPAGGAFTFSDIEIILSAPGDDILDLSRISDALEVHTTDDNDLIWTGSGNDLISGGVGNDVIDGGLGVDTVNLGRGDISDYTITAIGGGKYEVVHPTQGVDVLSNIEKLSVSNLVNGQDVVTTFDLANLVANPIPAPGTPYLILVALMGLFLSPRRNKRSYQYIKTPI